MGYILYSFEFAADLVEGLERVPVVQQFELHLRNEITIVDSIEPDWSIYITPQAILILRFPSQTSQLPLMACLLVLWMTFFFSVSCSSPRGRL
jgi:hypothetical protein